MITNYQILANIGSGSFSSVSLGRNKITGTYVALKMINKYSLLKEDEGVRFHREVELIKSFHHPFVAEFFELIEDDTYYYIVMEYAENGNMLNFVNTYGNLDENSARHYFCQLVSVLEYLHEVKQVAHRDLKAENVLLDRHNNIRIIDFGLSNVFTEKDPYLKTPCGSPGHPYTSESDLWSVGILLYAMVHGELPFDDDNTQRLLQKIIYTEPQYSESISPQLKDLLDKLLKKNPDERITLQKVKEHPWFSPSEYLYMNKLFCEPLIANSMRCNPQEDPIDREIVQQIISLGYDCKGIVQSILCDISTPETALYRMLKNDKKTDFLAELNKQRSMGLIIKQDSETQMQMSHRHSLVDQQVMRKQIAIPISVNRPHKLMSKAISPNMRSEHYSRSASIKKPNPRLPSYDVERRSTRPINHPPKIPMVRVRSSSKKESAHLSQLSV